MNLGEAPLIQKTIDALQVCVYENRVSMGTAAAARVVDKMKEVLSQKDQVRMVFAAAPSQNEFLNQLCQAEGVDWSRVVAFHMDEYIGLPAEATERFAHYLEKHLFARVQPGAVHLIHSTNDPIEECIRYSKLISEAPIDIVCLGIGENGHIAFNDPDVADFRDRSIMKLVALDEKCRMQQVHDGCFLNLDSVPKAALTLTVPTLMSANCLICVVPGATKYEAVRRTLTGPVSQDCPASILRTHSDCILFVDTESYGVTEHAGK